MSRIIVVGDLATDLLAVLAAPLAPGSDTPASIRLTAGGQGANTAAWLSWQDMPVTLVGAVGDDEAGRALLAELTAGGVTSAVQRYADAPTGSIIVLAEGQVRTMVTERGANLRLAPADVDAALDGAPDAIHLHLSAYTLLDGSSRDAGRRALAAARERGLTTSVDAASAAPLRRVGAGAFLDWVRGIDLLLANAEEAAVLAGPVHAGPVHAGPVLAVPVHAGGAEPAAQARALAEVARIAVVKLGADGAVWAEAGKVVTAPACRPSSTVDPTGAGDAFAAGLLAAWTRGADPATALQAGARLGAEVVARPGARPPNRRR